jgi:hypothetical protein
MESGAHPGEAVTAAIFKAMQDKLAEQKQNLLSIDDVTAMVAGQIGQLAPMDEKTTGLF